MVLTVPTYAIYMVYVLTDKDFVKNNVKRSFQNSITYERVQQFYAVVIIGGIGLLCLSFCVLKMYRATLFRIYHSEKDGLYTAVCRDNFFRLRRIKFFSEDVKEVQMTKTSLCNVQIKGIGYCVPHESFVSAAAFNNLRNYESRWNIEDKDISLRDARSKLRK